MDDSWPRDNSSSTGSQGYANQGQGTGGGYDNTQQTQQQDMGGGRGAFGSGVAGGYEGNQNQGQQNQGQEQQQNPGQGQQQQNWLDKGVGYVGQKAGVNVTNQQEDEIGDFINKEAKQYGGRNLPGVQ
ncbi:hypothetical protein AcV5_002939 [Taiwanofungus camphoratus]|nr:hypothetical protein AcV7_007191 [Antrodia cinnamomea]KAI0916443.1 hypothetical protein AcV5_002939 [Antrodia cinnamomea]